MIYIGIDPGLSGAVAWTRDNVTESISWDNLSCKNFIEQISTQETRCVIEKVGGYVGKNQPGSRMFSFGQNYGTWLGWLQMAHIPFIEVRPQEWQKGLTGLAKLVGTKRKGRLKEIAQARFPTKKVTLKNADALLLTVYAKKYYV